MMRRVGKELISLAAPVIRDEIQKQAAHLIKSRLIAEVQFMRGSHLEGVVSRHLAKQKGAPVAYQYERDAEKAFGNGSFFFRYKGHVMRAERTAPRSGTLSSRGDSNMDAVVTLQALTGGRLALDLFIGDAERNSLTSVGGGVKVYRLETGFGTPSWRSRNTIATRPLSAIVLDDHVGDDLLRDAQRFLGEAQWYADRHVPHKRGYLLYGPPGSGKSTLAGAIASELGYGVCALSLANRDLNDDGFVAALGEMPKRTVLLLEDVDAVRSSINSRNEEADLEAMKGGLTLGGILNALDGVGTPQGLITIMTTNHIEHLDPALIRPGRVDYRLKLDLASKEQAVKLYRKFFPEHEGYAEHFGCTVESHKHSPAELQEHLIRHRDNPLTAATFTPILD